MLKIKPKNFKCLDCGREQYTKDKCYSCNGKSFVSLINKENELRHLLHNTLDVMDFDQLKHIAKSLNIGNELIN